MPIFIRIAPVVFVCLWATGFVGARMAMPHAEPASFLAIRFAIAFALLAGLAIAAGAKWPKGRDFLHALVVGMLIHGLYLGSVFWAVNRGMPGGVSAIIVGLQPLLTALLARSWLGEELNLRHWIGLAIGFVGIIMVLLPGLQLEDSGIRAVTIGACLVGVAGITVGAVYQKRYATGLDLRSGNAVQYLGAFIPMMLFSFAFESFEIHWNGETLFAMAWLVFVLSIGAVFLLMWLIREGSVARVSSLFYLVPAVAALMTWALFGETLTPIQIIGTVLCALAVSLAAGGWRREKQAAASKAA